MLENDGEFHDIQTRQENRNCTEKLNESIQFPPKVYDGS